MAGTQNRAAWQTQERDAFRFFRLSGRPFRSTLGYSTTGEAFLLIVLSKLE